MIGAFRLLPRPKGKAYHKKRLGDRDMEIVNKDLMLSHQHIRKIGRDQFETALSHIRVGHGFVTPEILLLQLQFATIDPEKIRRHIMEFDTESIGKALDALIQRGLQ